jgi:hypothetical protein
MSVTPQKRAASLTVKGAAAYAACSLFELLDAQQRHFVVLKLEPKILARAVLAM